MLGVGGGGWQRGFPLFKRDLPSRDGMNLSSKRIRDFRGGEREVNAVGVPGFI